MYIGQFQMPYVTDVWGKNSSRQVKLFTAGPGNTMQPVVDTEDEAGGQKTVWAFNPVSTIAYRDAAFRYVMITEMNGTYWVVSAEC
jgi:hypothetical protein